MGGQNSKKICASRDFFFALCAYFFIALRANFFFALRVKVFPPPKPKSWIRPWMGVNVIHSSMLNYWNKAKNLSLFFWGGVYIRYICISSTYSKGMAMGGENRGGDCGFFLRVKILITFWDLQTKRMIVGKNPFRGGPSFNSASVHSRFILTR